MIRFSSRIREFFLVNFLEVTKEKRIFATWVHKEECTTFLDCFLAKILENTQIFLAEILENTQIFLAKILENTQIFSVCKGKSFKTPDKT